MEKSEIIKILEKQLKLLSEVSEKQSESGTVVYLAGIGVSITTIAKLLLEYNQQKEDERQLTKAALSMVLQSKNIPHSPSGIYPTPNS